MAITLFGLQSGFPHIQRISAEERARFLQYSDIDSLPECLQSAFSGKSDFSESEFKALFESDVVAEAISHAKKSEKSQQDLEILLSFFLNLIDSAIKLQQATAFLVIVKILNEMSQLSILYDSYINNFVHYLQDAQLNDEQIIELLGKAETVFGPNLLEVFKRGIASYGTNFHALHATLKFAKAKNNVALINTLFRLIPSNDEAQIINFLQQLGVDYLNSHLSDLIFVSKAQRNAQKLAAIRKYVSQVIPTIDTDRDESINFLVSCINCYGADGVKAINIKNPVILNKVIFKVFKETDSKSLALKNFDLLLPIIKSLFLTEQTEESFHQLLTNLYNACKKDQRKITQLMITLCSTDNKFIHLDHWLDWPMLDDNELSFFIVNCQWQDHSVLLPLLSKIKNDELRRETLESVAKKQFNLELIFTKVVNQIIEFYNTNNAEIANDYLKQKIEANRSLGLEKQFLINLFETLSLIVDKTNSIKSIIIVLETTLPALIPLEQFNFQIMTLLRYSEKQDLSDSIENLTKKYIEVFGYDKFNQLLFQTANHKENCITYLPIIVDIYVTNNQYHKLLDLLLNLPLLTLTGLQNATSGLTHSQIYSLLVNLKENYLKYKATENFDLLNTLLAHQLTVSESSKTDLQSHLVQYSGKQIVENSGQAFLTPRYALEILHSPAAFLALGAKIKRLRSHAGRGNRLIPIIFMATQIDDFNIYIADIVKNLILHCAKDGVERENLYQLILSLREFENSLPTAQADKVKNFVRQVESELYYQLASKEERQPIEKNREHYHYSRAGTDPLINILKDNALFTERSAFAVQRLTINLAKIVGERTRNRDKNMPPLVSSFSKMLSVNPSLIDVFFNTQYCSVEMLIRVLRYVKNEAHVNILGIMLGNIISMDTDQADEYLQEMIKQFCSNLLSANKLVIDEVVKTLLRHPRFSFALEKFKVSAIYFQYIDNLLKRLPLEFIIEAEHLNTLLDTFASHASKLAGRYKYQYINSIILNLNELIIRINHLSTADQMKYFNSLYQHKLFKDPDVFAYLLVHHGKFHLNAKILFGILNSQQTDIDTKKNVLRVLANNHLNFTISVDALPEFATWLAECKDVELSKTFQLRVISSIVSSISKAKPLTMDTSHPAFQTLITLLKSHPAFKAYILEERQIKNTNTLAEILIKACDTTHGNISLITELFDALSGREIVILLNQADQNIQHPATVSHIYRDILLQYLLSEDALQARSSDDLESLFQYCRKNDLLPILQTWLKKILDNEAVIPFELSKHLSLFSDYLLSDAELLIYFAKFTGEKKLLIAEIIVKRATEEADVDVSLFVKLFDSIKSISDFYAIIKSATPKAHQKILEALITHLSDEELTFSEWFNNLTQDEDLSEVISLSDAKIQCVLFLIQHSVDKLLVQELSHYIDNYDHDFFYNSLQRAIYELIANAVKDNLEIKPNTVLYKYCLQLLSSSTLLKKYRIDQATIQYLYQFIEVDDICDIQHDLKLEVETAKSVNCLFGPFQFSDQIAEALTSCRWFQRLPLINLGLFRVLDCLDFDSIAEFGDEQVELSDEMQTMFINFNQIQANSLGLLLTRETTLSECLALIEILDLDNADFTTIEANIKKLEKLLNIIPTTPDLSTRLQAIFHSSKLNINTEEHQQAMADLLREIAGPLSDVYPQRTAPLLHGNIQLLMRHEDGKINCYIEHLFKHEQLLRYNLAVLLEQCLDAKLLEKLQSLDLFNIEAESNLEKILNVFKNIPPDKLARLLRHLKDDISKQTETAFTRMFLQTRRAWESVRQGIHQCQTFSQDAQSAMTNASILFFNTYGDKLPHQSHGGVNHNGVSVMTASDTSWITKQCHHASEEAASNLKLASEKQQLVAHALVEFYLAKIKYNPLTIDEQEILAKTLLSLNDFVKYINRLPQDILDKVLVLAEQQAEEAEQFNQLIESIYEKIIHSTGDIKELFNIFHEMELTDLLSLKSFFIEAHATQFSNLLELYLSWHESDTDFSVLLMQCLSSGATSSIDITILQNEYELIERYISKKQQAICVVFVVAHSFDAIDQAGDIEEQAFALLRKASHIIIRQSLENTDLISDFDLCQFLLSYQDYLIDCDNAEILLVFQQLLAHVIKNRPNLVYSLLHQFDPNLTSKLLSHTMAGMSHSSRHEVLMVEAGEVEDYCSKIQTNENYHEYFSDHKTHLLCVRNLIKGSSDLTVIVDADSAADVPPYSWYLYTRDKFGNIVQGYLVLDENRKCLITVKDRITGRSITYNFTRIARELNRKLPTEPQESTFTPDITHGDVEREVTRIHRTTGDPTRAYREDCQCIFSSLFDFATKQKITESTTDTLITQMSTDVLDKYPKACEVVLTELIHKAPVYNAEKVNQLKQELAEITTRIAALSAEQDALKRSLQLKKEALEKTIKESEAKSAELITLRQEIDALAPTSDEYQQKRQQITAILMSEVFVGIWIQRFLLSPRIVSMLGSQEFIRLIEEYKLVSRFLKHDQYEELKTTMQRLMAEIAEETDTEQLKQLHKKLAHVKRSLDHIRDYRTDDVTRIILKQLQLDILVDKSSSNSELQQAALRAESIVANYIQQQLTEQFANRLCNTIFRWLRGNPYCGDISKMEQSWFQRLVEYIPHDQFIAKDLRDVESRGTLVIHLLYDEDGICVGELSASGEIQWHENHGSTKVGVGASLYHAPPKRGGNRVGQVQHSGSAELETVFVPSTTINLLLYAPIDELLQAESRANLFSILPRMIASLIGESEEEVRAMLGLGPTEMVRIPNDQTNLLISYMLQLDQLSEFYSLLFGAGEDDYEDIDLKKKWLTKAVIYRLLGRGHASQDRYPISKDTALALATYHDTDELIAVIKFYIKGDDEASLSAKMLLKHMLIQEKHAAAFTADIDNCNALFNLLQNDKLNLSVDEILEWLPYISNPMLRQILYVDILCKLDDVDENSDQYINALNLSFITDLMLSRLPQKVCLKLLSLVTSYRSLTESQLTILFINAFAGNTDNMIEFIKNFISNHQHHPYFTNAFSLFFSHYNTQTWKAIHLLSQRARDDLVDIIMHEPALSKMVSDNVGKYTMFTEFKDDVKQLIQKVAESFDQEYDPKTDIAKLFSEEKLFYWVKRYFSESQFHREDVAILLANALLKFLNTDRETILSSLTRENLRLILLLSQDPYFISIIKNKYPILPTLFELLIDQAANKSYVDIFYTDVNEKNLKTFSLSFAQTSFSASPKEWVGAWNAAEWGNFTAFDYFVYKAGSGGNTEGLNTLQDLLMHYMLSLKMKPDSQSLFRLSTLMNNNSVHNNTRYAILYTLLHPDIFESITKDVLIEMLAFNHEKVFQVLLLQKRFDDFDKLAKIYEQEIQSSLSVRANQFFGNWENVSNAFTRAKLECETEKDIESEDEKTGRDKKSWWSLRAWWRHRYMRYQKYNNNVWWWAGIKACLPLICYPPKREYAQSGNIVRKPVYIKMVEFHQPKDTETQIEQTDHNDSQSKIEASLDMPVSDVDDSPLENDAFLERLGNLKHGNADETTIVSLYRDRLQYIIDKIANEPEDIILRQELQTFIEKIRTDLLVKNVKQLLEPIKHLIEENDALLLQAEMIALYEKYKEQDIFTRDVTALSANLTIIEISQDMLVDLRQFISLFDQAKILKAKQSHLSSESVHVYETVVMRCDKAQEFVRHNLGDKLVAANESEHEPSVSIECRLSDRS